MKRLRAPALLLAGSLCLLFVLLPRVAGAQGLLSCTLSANPSSTPPGGSVRLQGSCSNTTASTTYTWSGPGTSSCSSKSSNCTIMAPSTPGTYLYTLTPFDPNTGLTGVPGNTRVTVVALPASCTLAASPTMPAPNALVQLQGTCVNLPAGSSFTWSGPGTSVCSASSSNCTVHAPLVPGPATYTLVASYPGGATEPASVTINVSGNLTLILVSGNNQLAIPGQPLAAPLVVRLVDAQGAPVTGVAVSWAGANARDMLSATSVVSDAAGLASITVILSSDPGDRTFTASAFGSSVTFIARDLVSNVVKAAQQLLVPMTRTALTSTQVQLDNIDRHLDGVRQSCASGGGGATVNGEPLGKLFGDAFLAGEINIGRQATTSQQSGYKLTTKGLTLGTDVSCGGGYIFGVAIGYFRADTGLDGSGDENAHGTSASLWGSYLPPFLANAYVDLVANFGHNDYNSQRQTTLSDLSAGTTGDQAALASRAGYRFSSGRMQLDPYLRVQHIEAKVHGFGESGGPDAIALSDVKVKSTVESFGGTFRYTFDTPAGEITPHLRLELYHQSQDNSGSVTAWLVASPDAAQATTTLPQSDHSYGNWSVGASGIFQQHYEWYVNYERSFGNEFRTSAFSARVRIRF